METSGGRQGLGTSAAVIVATKGRPVESGVLLGWLSAQSVLPCAVVIVGHSPEDLPSDAAIKGALAHYPVHALVCPQAGSSLQRNYGLDRVFNGDLDMDAPDIVVFFDDDFRPAPDWIEGCLDTFAAADHIAGLTGWVLADGVKGAGLIESEAEAFVNGERPKQAHWSDRAHLSPLGSAYGCNMAFHRRVAETLRFDEALPLYAWQEDRDYTGQCRDLGPTVLSRKCRGVHLGAKRGRTSGLKLGYSQIANPVHIAKRGNMQRLVAFEFVFRALASNLVRSFGNSDFTDYKGRLRGNGVALLDLIKGDCRPQRVLDL